MVHLRSLESTQEATFAFGYHLKQLLHFSLQTSSMHQYGGLSL